MVGIWAPQSTSSGAGTRARSALQSECCCRGASRRARSGPIEQVVAKIGEDAMSTRGMVDPELLAQLELMPSFELSHETLIIARDGMDSILMPLEEYARPEI